jgi:hypothetical protein
MSGRGKKYLKKRIYRTWKETEKQCYYSENPKNRRQNCVTNLCKLHTSQSEAHATNSTPSQAIQIQMDEQTA